MESILAGAPWLIAHRSMLGINQLHKITFQGKDYVLWQNSQGEVFALDNICPHMQAPLSDGWICQDGNAIACPFHALEFDTQGRLCAEGKPNSKSGAKPLLQALELIVSNDCIWTYGGFAPRLPIPELHQRIVDEFEFIGVAGEKSIQSDFLSSLMVNYDFNHQNGTHRELFRIVKNEIPQFEENGYYTKVTQDLYKASNSLREILRDPVLLTVPKVYRGYLEYAFPSTTVFETQTAIGKVAQVHILYPETANRTKTFVLAFAELKYPFLKILLKESFLRAVSKVVEQDSNALESLYPREKPKIRLPNEEIMFYAEKLYREW
jgi:phenylpropionate dioxygenase-like ring-hydroxylating dioxygenase large terminal subunit